MSRIGKKVIKVPETVQLTVSGQDVSVKGPKGTLSRVIHSTCKLNHKDGLLNVELHQPSKENSKFQGLTRSLVANMVAGVQSGFEKKLILKGVGYRAVVKGNSVQLTLGFSHLIDFPIPEGISIKSEKIGSDPGLVVSGIDKELVGQVAANIRSFRKPEPYHGKGVRYADEVIVTKVGKAAGKK